MLQMLHQGSSACLWIPCKNLFSVHDCFISFSEVNPRLKFCHCPFFLLQPMQPTEAGFEDGEEEEEEEDEKLTWTAAVIQSTAYNVISLPIVLFAVVANDVRCLLP